MAIDWDRVVVESDDNGVVISAGQVALLIGADADTVTWGNITGDITQQPDLMALVDGFVSADSPQFTGTPRTPTPPAGNRSTRIASTAYVQGELDTANNDKYYGRKNSQWSALGAIASKDTVDYGTEVTNKPTLGTLAKADEPPRNTSANIIEKWVRVNATVDGQSYPYWTELDEPPDSYQVTKYYARTSYAIESEGIILYRHGWQILKEMAQVDDAPSDGHIYGRQDGQWVRID